MDHQEADRQKNICPSCGKSAFPSFWPTKMSERIKMLLILFIAGYAVLSAILLVVGSPTPVRGYPIPMPRPDQRLIPVGSSEPAPLFQIMIGIGYAALILYFTFNYWRQVIREWQQRRSGQPVKKKIVVFRYKCRYCGCEWEADGY
jgi:hypothetical protein